MKLPAYTPAHEKHRHLDSGNLPSCGPGVDGQPQLLRIQHDIADEGGEGPAVGGGFQLDGLHVRGGNEEPVFFSMLFLFVAEPPDRVLVPGLVGEGQV